MSKIRIKRQHKEHHEPTIAPGLEMDELEWSASKEEIEHGDYTEVTKLVIDRIPGDEH